MKTAYGKTLNRVFTVQSYSGTVHGFEKLQIFFSGRKQVPEYLLVEWNNSKTLNQYLLLGFFNFEGNVLLEGALREAILR